MLVISDTSPLNYLVLISRQDILPSLFGKVLIPPAVWRELRAAATPPVVRQWMVKLPSWLEVKQPGRSARLEPVSLG